MGLIATRISGPPLERIVPYPVIYTGGEWQVERCKGEFRGIVRWEADTIRTHTYPTYDRALTVARHILRLFRQGEG